MLYQVISGAIMANCWTIGFFFLRFWKRTRDRFFLIFSLSFCMMGLDRLVLFLFYTPNELEPRVYLIRLMSFILILAAIVDKNQSGKKPIK
jgi:hypothetical protein